MPIVSPVGDPSDDKHLWWRCVFIAAGIQPILILLYLMFGSTFIGKILLILFFPFIASVVLAFWTNPASPIPIFWFLLPVCIVLNSFILGAIFYFVCWLKEKDF